MYLETKNGQNDQNIGTLAEEKAFYGFYLNYSGFCGPLFARQTYGLGLYLLTIMFNLTIILCVLVWPFKVFFIIQSSKKISE